jgi:hypothetical protein
MSDTPLQRYGVDWTPRDGFSGDMVKQDEGEWVRYDSLPQPMSEITELDLQNSGSQQTVEQLARAFDEVDAEGAMRGAFGSEGMNALVERYRRRVQPQAVRAETPEADPPMWTWTDKITTLCVECGPNVRVDEDGCCLSCGNGALPSETAMARLRAAVQSDIPKEPA